MIYIQITLFKTKTLLNMDAQILDCFQGKNFEVAVA